MSKKEADVKQDEQTTAVTIGIDFEQDAGKGMEGADQQSFAIPFLSILQGLSPQLDRIEGARPGMIINSVTEEIMKRVLVIPCAFQRRYIRWAPRDAGGGYKGEVDAHTVESGACPNAKLIDGRWYVDVPEDGNPLNKEGKPRCDILADTRNHFVLYQAEDMVWRRALISLGSAQIKKSKRWMAMIGSVEMKNAAGKTFQPPSYACVYAMSTVLDKNNKGTWHSAEFAPVMVVGEADVYMKAKAFHDDVAKGAVEVSAPVDSDEDVVAPASAAF